MKIVIIGAAATLLALAGCENSPSSGVKLKEGEFFRVVNGTGRDLDIRFDNLQIYSPMTPAGSYCDFRKDSPKPHRFDVYDLADGKAKDKIWSTSVKFEGGAIRTYVLVEKGGSFGLETVANEERGVGKPGKSEVRFAVAGIETPPEVVLDGDGGKVPLGEPSSDPDRLEPGHYRVLVAGKPQGEIDLEDGKLSTLLVYGQGGKVKTLFMVNSPQKMQTASANAAASGG